MDGLRGTISEHCRQHPQWKVRCDIHKKDALERNAVKEIAGLIDRCTVTGKILYCIYLLCISCELRVVEIHRANVEDIVNTLEKHQSDILLSGFNSSLNSHILFVFKCVYYIKSVGNHTYLYIQGKGHSEHDQPVLLIPEVKSALQEYLDSRGDHYTKKSPLFVSTSKERCIPPSTISSMLKEALVNTEYDSDRLTAHSLRHTSGTGAYRATGNIYLAQKHQRHANPSTNRNLRPRRG